MNAFNQELKADTSREEPIVILVVGPVALAKRL